MTDTFEVHDPAILANARAVLDACRSAKEMQDAVIAAVRRNEDWRGQRCINLLAPEPPTSPAVRALLSAEVGTCAAEGNIGAVNRWFAGTQYIDEIEALCVELLKKVFRARYADHRLVASMLGVRREGITQAAGNLQRAGIIRYRRGHIAVLERSGLETRVCECYAVVKQELVRLLSDVSCPQGTSQRTMHRRELA